MVKPKKIEEVLKAKPVMCLLLEGNLVQNQVILETKPSAYCTCCRHRAYKIVRVGGEACKNRYAVHSKDYGWIEIAEWKKRRK